MAMSWREEEELKRRLSPTMATPATRFNLLKGGQQDRMLRQQEGYFDEGPSAAADKVAAARHALKFPTERTSTIDGGPARSPSLFKAFTGGPDSVIQNAATGLGLSPRETPSAMIAEGQVGKSVNQTVMNEARGTKPVDNYIMSPDQRFLLWRNGQRPTMTRTALDGQTRYTVPGVRGSMMAEGEITGPPRGGYVDPRRNTTSGGDQFMGSDVSEMSPTDYAKFKVDRMNQAANAIRDFRQEQASARGLTPTGTSAIQRNERKQLLKDYKRELNDTIDSIRRGRLTAAGGRNAVAGVQDYFSQALSLSPQAEEAGRNYRQELAGNAMLQNTAMEQEGYNQRTAATLAQKGVPGQFEMIKTQDGLNEVLGKINPDGSVTYSPAIEAAKVEYQKNISNGMSKDEADQLFFASTGNYYDNLQR